MLVTNPQLRAPLPDLLNHPWMTRGYEGPPDAQLLRREPLCADELDRQVIRGMTVFEFGTEDEIERRLEFMVNRCNPAKGETYANAKKLGQELLDNCRGVVGQPPLYKDGEMSFRDMQHIS
jgi:hypothetical protein